jgi:hypothetical protein
MRNAPYSIEFYLPNNRRLFEATRDGKMLNFEGNLVEFDAEQIPTDTFEDLESAKSFAADILSRYPNLVVAIISQDEDDKIFIVDEGAQAKIRLSQKSWYRRRFRNLFFENTILLVAAFGIVLLVLALFFGRG